jgi:acyl-CoA synthetase (NDP forming)
MQPTVPGVPVDIARVRALLDGVRAEGRTNLLETEGRALLAAAGIALPPAIVLPAGTAADPDALDAASLAALGTDRVVVKAVAAGLAHKTESGGVAVVPAARDAVATAVAAMRSRIPDAVAFSVNAFVAHDAGPGGELLVGLRWTEDVGPVVTVGLGGIHAEALAGDLRPGRATAILSPALTARSRLAELLLATTAVRLAATAQRGRPPVAPLERIVETVDRFLDLAATACGPGLLAELEVNPFAATLRGLVALDVLGVLAPMPDDLPPPRPPRPVDKLPRLLAPRSVAIIGVSAGMNVGRIILRNLLRDGFDPAAVTVVKPGVGELDGCRCVPALGAMREPVDLFVVAVSAAQAAGVVAEVAERGLAESLIVIPGGLEEKHGTEALVARMHEALAAARRRPDRGPIVNGGNCLGIRSVPGRYDTLFIPATKLAPPGGRPAPLALLAQSGAFGITRLDRLTGLDPKYVITVGNQMDLTLGDHLGHLADDPDLAVVGVYTEGFARGDALPFLRAARRMRESGRTVVLYRGGRSAAGQTASASHTAAIAGDVAVTDALARQCGVVVADTLADFDDLVKTFTLLHGRTVGPRLAAVTNAGFECVAIADRADGPGDPLTLEPIEGVLATRLSEVFRETGIDAIVDLHDPLDLTPAAGDAAYASVVSALLEAPRVDVVLAGNVPFSVELATLPPGPGHAEDLAASTAVGPRLLDLAGRSSKAVVAVVDAGPRYDPLAALLEGGGIPTFRTADAAMRALGAVVAARSTRS